MSNARHTPLACVGLMLDLPGFALGGLRFTLGASGFALGPQGFSDTKMLVLAT